MFFLVCTICSIKFLAIFELLFEIIKYFRFFTEILVSKLICYGFDAFDCLQIENCLTVSADALYMYTK